MGFLTASPYSQNTKLRLRSVEHLSEDLLRRTCSRLVLNSRLTHGVAREFADDQRNMAAIPLSGRMTASRSSADLTPCGQNTETAARPGIYPTLA
jgi:hypothetical protein